MVKFSLVVLLLCSLIAIGYADSIGRIVGGAPAKVNEFPYQIALQRGGSFTCGGSIISRNYVLTAAHCVTYEQNGKYYAYAANTFDIRAGSIDRTTGGVVIKVSKITFNQNYGSNLLHDVAVLLLEKSLTFAANIQAIELASQEVPSGSPVVISGFGRLSTGGEIPKNLQYNTLEAISKSQCLVIGQYTDTLLCLAHKAGNGACNGDSGGPAKYDGKLVGVAGFVVNGCGSSNPDGYAKVSYHREWIIKNTDL